jgi:hypothetical protein
MALGVKGKWKQPQDGAKDYSWEPETANVHKIHSVRQDPYR